MELRVTDPKQAGQVIGHIMKNGPKGLDGSPGEQAGSGGPGGGMTLPRYQPMLATAWPAPFTESGWHFEPKWDGIRGILAWNGSTVTLHTRTGAEVASRLPELVPSKTVPVCVLDGEVVVLSGGRASFERLQQRSALSPLGLRDHPVSFVAFDLLHLDQRSLIEAPIEERRNTLESLGLSEPFVTVNPVDDGNALWSVVVQRISREWWQSVLGVRTGPGGALRIGGRSLTSTQ